MTSAPNVSATQPTQPGYVTPASYNSPTYNPYPSLSSEASLYPSASYPSAYTLANNAQSADNALGPQLSIYQNPVTQPNAEQAYTNQYYNTYLAPGIAQTQTQLYNNGMLNSSAGGAELGTQTAQAQAQAGLQGQQYYTQALNNFLNTRSNFFGTSGQLATNSAAGQLQATTANQNVAGQLANLGAELPQLANQYGLQSTSALNQYQQQNASLANSYLQNTYGTNAALYGNQLANNQRNYAAQEQAKSSF